MKEKIENREEESEQNYKIIATGFFAGLIGITLIIFAYQLDNDYERKTITILVCSLGLILGWIVGILTTPYDKKDEKSVSRFSKLVGTFLTGYILSKSDKIFETVLDVNFIFSKSGGIRILFFLCFFGLAWIVVFVFRLYATGKIEPKRIETELNKKE